MPSTADIPAVESRIVTARRIISAHWDQTSAAAVRDAVEELEWLEERGIEGEPRTAQIAAILAVLLLMRKRMDEPLPDRTRTRARRLANELIEAGVQTTGGFGRLTRGGPVMRKMAKRGGAELEALSRWRFRNERVQAELDASIDDFVRREETRRSVQQRKADQKRLRELIQRRRERENAKRRAEGKPELKGPIPEPEKPKRKDDKPAAEDRREWLEGLRSIMAKTENTSDVIADAWAYRQYNIGQYLGLRARGVRAIVAFNNPPSGPDERTTRFCRWVHQKPIKVDRIEGQLRELARAVREDDRALVETAWPMLRLRRGDATSDFRRMFLGVGLPPFHWRCRSVVQERLL